MHYHSRKSKIELHTLIYALLSKKIKNKVSCIQRCILIQNKNNKIKKIKFHAFIYAFFKNNKTKNIKFYAFINAFFKKKKKKK